MAQRRMGMIAFLFCVCLCLRPCRAQAASTADAVEFIAPERECTLTLSYGHAGTTFAGLKVKLYHIADVSKDFRYTLTEPFRSCGLDLNGIRSAGEWNAVRSTLESRILAGRIPPTRTAVTDRAGQVRFEALKPGLYLAIAEDALLEDVV